MLAYWIVKAPPIDCIRRIERAQASRFPFAVDQIEASPFGGGVRLYGRYGDRPTNRGYMTCLIASFEPAAPGQTRVVRRGRLIWPVMIIFGLLLMGPAAAAGFLLSAALSGSMKLGPGPLFPLLGVPAAMMVFDLGFLALFWFVPGKMEQTNLTKALAGALAEPAQSSG